MSVKVARGELWVCEKGTGKEDPNPVHVGLRYLLDIQAENHIGRGLQWTEPQGRSLVGLAVHFPRTLEKWT